MARKPRIEYEGAFYHVISRGNQKQRIFKCQEDYLKYLEILSHYKDRYRYFLYSYVLMSDHIHLLIETQKMPLSKILQGVSQSYTAYFNRRYKTTGHLFQGRYKAILCDRDAYLLTLVKYIHLNPVRARIVKDPEDYHWSSHRNYLRKAGKKDIIDDDQVLRMFSEDKSKSRRFYKEYMSDGLSVKRDDIYGTIDQRLLGDERFAEKVMELSDESVGKIRRKKEYTLSEIASGIEETHGITLRQIREKGKGRDISVGKKLLSLVADEYGYKGKEVARYIQKDPAIVTRQLKEKGTLKREMEKVIEKLEEKGSYVNSQA